MTAWKIMDFLELAIYAVIGVGVTALLLAEPVEIFWNSHTWREENGRFVRDYTELWRWAKRALKTLLLWLLWLGLFILIYRVI